MTWSVSLPTGFRPHRNLVIFTAKGLVPLGGVARVPTSAVVASTSVDAAVQACSPALESFEGWTDNGKYAVGVALRGGLVTEEVASCLREKQMPKLARPTGMSVREAIPGDFDDRKKHSQARRHCGSSERARGGGLRADVVVWPV